MSRGLLLLLFFGAACQSKPNKNMDKARNPQQVVGKVTNAPQAPRPEVFVQVEYCPRREHEFELGVVGNEFVKACLTAHFAASRAPSSVSLEGKINYPGGLHNVTVSSPDEEFKKCVMEALPKIKLGRGKVGPFKMGIATAPDLIKGAKGMVLMPPEVKRFE